MIIYFTTATTHCGCQKIRYLGCMTLTANTSWSPWKTTGNTFGQATESANTNFLAMKRLRCKPNSNRHLQSTYSRGVGRSRKQLSTPFLAHQKYEKSHSCQFRVSYLLRAHPELNATYTTCTCLEIRCPQNLIDKAKSSDQF